jgi:hypothetical protein
MFVNSCRLVLIVLYFGFYEKKVAFFNSDCFVVYVDVYSKVVLK